MTVVVSLDGVARRHADRQVLDDVTLAVDDRDRVGVIGRNGSGKSTLLRLVAGVDAPDAGRIVLGSSVRIAYVPQEPEFDPRTPVLDAAGAQPPEFGPANAALDPAGALRQARAYLEQLGLGAQVDRPVGELSGGQRKRVALARGLAAEAELLVLDEPTNHLDVDAVEWLEGRLRGRPGALVLVTHDRYLLDRLATRIVEVEGGRLHAGHGSYADYLEERARREEQAAAAERRHRNRARVELAWLRRAPAARTTKSRVRTERAEALLAAGRGEEPSELALAMPTRRLGSRVVDLEGAGKRYGDRWVLRGVDTRLARGARVGVVGPNGSGKTTLLALLAGRIEPDEGRVVVGETVVAGWYGQDPEDLPPHQRVLDAVDEVARETVLPDSRRVGAGQLCERFGFGPSLQRSWIGELSGGERRRLELLRVLAGAPNLLLLDEPTNDLDLDTLEVLEEFFDTWPGALVVASHDRYFLDRVCDDVFAVEDGRLRHYPGGWRAWRASQAAAPSPNGTTRPRPTPAERPRRPGYAQRRELAGLERRLGELEAHKADLTAALQRPGAGYDEVRSTGEALSAVVSELEQTEERWLELAEIGE